MANYTVKPKMATNVIQLRQMLAEKFPGTGMGIRAMPASENDLWPTGLSQIDEPLRGGLRKGELAEIIEKKNFSGSATLIRQLLAAGKNQIIALVDGHDSLDVTQLDERLLSRMLWVRCRGANMALNAADIILRDANVPLVFVDLKLNSEQQLRKIPPNTWYRFQRLVEQTATVCIFVTPYPMVSPAHARIIMNSRFSLKSLDTNNDELLQELRVEISDRRQFGELRNFSAA